MIFYNVIIDNSNHSTLRLGLLCRIGLLSRPTEHRLPLATDPIPPYDPQAIMNDRIKIYVKGNPKIPRIRRPTLRKIIDDTRAAIQFSQAQSGKLAGKEQEHAWPKGARARLQQ